MPSCFCQIYMKFVGVVGGNKALYQEKTVDLTVLKGLFSSI